jgi:hypothetical protein
VKSVVQIHSPRPFLSTYILNHFAVWIIGPIAWGSVKGSGFGSKNALQLIF